MPLTAIRSLITKEMAAVDQLILRQLYSRITLIEEVGQHLITSGGKRLRPMLVLLAANCFAYAGDEHILLAAIIEFIHTATLLHDDVVDNSLLRRGQATANAMWGNEASVLVGDFVYSRSFQMMAQLNNNQVIKILADTTNLIAEGEVLQLLNQHNEATSEEQYFDAIRGKTATLFAAATKLGAVINERSEDEIQALSDYGLYLGLAFQLVDDALDYSADSQTIGKNIGDDLKEGKPTLPLIHAMKHGTTEQKALIENAIKNGTAEDIELIQQAILATEAIAYTYQVAKEQVTLAKKALVNIVDSQYKQALITLADFVVERTF